MPIPVYHAMQKVQIFAYQHVNLEDREDIYFYMRGCPSNLRAPAYVICYLLPSDFGEAGNVQLDFVHCGRRGELGCFHRTVDAGRGFCHFPTGSMTDFSFNYTGYAYAFNHGRPLRRLKLDPIYAPIEPHFGFNHGVQTDPPPNGAHILGYSACFGEGRRRVIWANLIRMSLSNEEIFLEWANHVPLFCPSTASSSNLDYSRL